MRTNTSLTTIASILLLLFANNPAVGKDLELLVRYLVPVFLAQNFAAACRASIPDFWKGLPAGVVNVNMASATIRNEITDGLPRNEAAEIVLVAANTARHAATEEMHTLSADGQTISGEVLNRWCRERASPYVLQVLSMDQLAHDRFVAIMEQAKH